MEATVYSLKSSKKIICPLIDTCGASFTMHACVRFFSFGGGGGVGQLFSSERHLTFIKSHIHLSWLW